MADIFLSRSRWQHGTVLLCGLYVAASPLPAAAETLFLGLSKEATEQWSREATRDDVETPYQKRRSALRGAVEPPPRPEPIVHNEIPLPPPSLLTQRPAQALKIVIPNLKASRQIAMPAAPAAVKPPANYDHLAFTPVPPRITPAAANNQAIANLPAPLANIRRLVEAVPLSPVQPVPLMVAKAGPEPKQETPLEIAQATYHSPGPIIRKETFHLIPPDEARTEEAPPAAINLAELAPAAGASEGVMVPLIELPEQMNDTPVPVPAATLAPAPSQPENKTAEAEPEKEEARDSFGASALDQVLRTLSNETPVSEAPDALPTIVTVPGEPPAASPSKQAEEPVKPEEPVKKAAEEKAAPAEEKEPAAAKAEIGEPRPGLSPESEQILKNIPSNLDKRKKPVPELSIKHAKDTEYVSKATKNNEATATATAQHEAMGIKLAVKQSPINLNYELEKAYNALVNGQTQAAIAIYKNVLANDDKNILALFGLATTYHRAGQIDMARPLYGKLLALDPDNRDALNNFLVLLADEAPQEALDQLARLEERNPDFSPIPAQMAVIYQKMGDTDKASEKMFKAIALAPENLTYRYNLAIMLDKQDKYDEAGRLYKQIVEAHMRGEVTPGNIQQIQERLTFISSNKP